MTQQQAGPRLERSKDQLRIAPPRTPVLRGCNTRAMVERKQRSVLSLSERQQESSIEALLLTPDLSFRRWSLADKLLCNRGVDILRTFQSPVRGCLHETILLTRYGWHVTDRRSSEGRLHLPRDAHELAVLLASFAAFASALRDLHSSLVD
jgi:hypothetical protein